MIMASAFTLLRSAQWKTLNPSLAGCLRPFPPYRQKLTTRLEASNRRGMEAKIMAGITPWKPPLGYVCQHAKKRGKKKLQPDQPDPVVFPIVQATLRDYAAGRFSQVDLVRLLDERGLAETRGLKTHAQLVTRLLYDYLNFYRGYLLNHWSGELVGAPCTSRCSRKKEEYLAILAVRDGRGSGLAVKRPRFNELFAPSPHSNLR